MPERTAERVFAPAYLWDFVCDGAACGSKCCGSWRIPLDEVARKRWGTLPPAAREAVFARVIRKETGWEMRHGADGNCAFLDGDGLCRLQKRHGESYLPDICDAYPRVSYRFAGFVERSLAPTCPVAARRMLTPQAPMRFALRETPPRRASSAVRPSTEALRWEDALPALQRRMIALLQDRTRPLRLRFLALGRFLAALSSRAGDNPPEAGALDAVSPDAEETMTRASGFSCLRFVAALVAEMYGAQDAYPPARLDALADRLAHGEAALEAALHKRHGQILENFAVNECFLRLYPFACTGGFAANFRLFALRFRIVEAALLLDAVARQETPDEERTLLLVGHVSERLYHNRGAEQILQRRAVEDFAPLSVDAFFAQI